MSFVTLTGWGVDQRNMFGSRFPINNLQSQIDGFAARPFRHTLRFRFSFAMLETRKRGQEVLDVDCVGDVSEWGAPKSPPPKKTCLSAKTVRLGNFKIHPVGTNGDHGTVVVLYGGRVLWHSPVTKEIKIRFGPIRKTCDEPRSQ